MRRNQIVASLLHRVDLVENMGTGIGKIRRMCKKAGCFEPEFEFDSFFTPIFKRDTGTKFTVTSESGLIDENKELNLNRGESSVESLGESLRDRVR